MNLMSMNLIVYEFDRLVWFIEEFSIKNIYPKARLSDFPFTFHFHALEREMATHSSVLAWRIPGMGAWWAAVSGVAQSPEHLIS